MSDAKTPEIQALGSDILADFLDEAGRTLDRLNEQLLVLDGWTLFFAPWAVGAVLMGVMWKILAAAGLPGAGR